MLFSSLIFLFVFLPALLAFYYLTPKKFRNYLLLLASLLFYAWGGVSYSLILIVSIGVNYLLVRAIERSQNNKKIWLSCGLLFNVSVIVIFKYLDFIIENINGIAGVITENAEVLPLQHIVLPVGISFFTFQQMSLLWDIYRNPDIERANLFDTALYISLFPQLIAGPIVRYNDIIDQIKNRIESIDLFRSGVQRFILGLFKKIVFANTCAAIADSIMDNPIDLISTPVAWLGIVAYAFQIYFDFAGYSDMAIGLGRMFGFKILENFNFPYISRSIKEFWHRWHISLSTWFRDYVYIPLGGNRQGAYKTYFNLLVVFLLTGFWHGATWSFVAWGLFHGLFLTVEKLGLDRLLLKLPKVMSWCYTALVILVGWVMFRIEELPDALLYIGKLFGMGATSDVYLVSYLDRERILILVLAVLSSSTIFIWLKDKVSKANESMTLLYRFCADLALITMFLYAVMYINSGSYNPFIYFRF